MFLADRVGKKSMLFFTMYYIFGVYFHLMYIYSVYLLPSIGSINIGHHFLFQEMVYLIFQ